MKNHERLAERLADILIRLNQGERLSIEDLADDYKVSQRTIRRDFDRLCMLAFSETGKHYRIDKNKQGHLSSQDVHRFARFASIQDLLPEIDREFFHDTLNQNILVKGFEYEDIRHRKDEFDALVNAIETNKSIQFNYTKIRGEEKTTKAYDLEPYHLLNKNGIWYLVGLREKEQRIFCFTQIHDIKIRNQTFVLNKRIKEQMTETDSIFFGNQISEIIVQVNAKVAAYFERRNLLPNQEIIRKLENGDLLLACKEVNPREVIPIVQYWIPELRIMSPVGIQEKMMDVLKHYIKDH